TGGDGSYSIGPIYAAFDEPSYVVSASLDGWTTVAQPVHLEPRYSPFRVDFTGAACLSPASPATATETSPPSLPTAIPTASATVTPSATVAPSLTAPPAASPTLTASTPPTLAASPTIAASATLTPPPTTPLTPTSTLTV